MKQEKLKAIYPALSYFPRTWLAQVSSPLKGLTSVFGMETGVTLSQKIPGKLLSKTWIRADFLCPNPNNKLQNWQSQFLITGQKKFK